MREHDRDGHWSSRDAVADYEHEREGRELVEELAHWNYALMNETRSWSGDFGIYRDHLRELVTETARDLVEWRRRDRDY